MKMTANDWRRLLMRLKNIENTEKHWQYWKLLENHSKILEKSDKHLIIVKTILKITRKTLKLLKKHLTHWKIPKNTDNIGNYLEDTEKIVKNTDKTEK